jgi:mannose-1-phosphate guanylyltransferase
LRIIERDHAARVLILPSDHYVHDEAVLESVMHMALSELRCSPLGVALLGVEAEQADSELGYIVPGFELRGGFDTVRRFVEKPLAQEAYRLCNEGAVWNSFILACRAQSLLALYLTHHREVVEALHASMRCASPALEQRYAQLPPIDFSRDIVTGQESKFALMRVPRCGWNDLGTPERLARTLARYHQLAAPRRMAAPPRANRINLAERLLHTYPQYGGSGMGTSA